MSKRAPDPTEVLLALLKDNNEPEETVAESSVLRGAAGVKPDDVARARTALESLTSAPTKELIATLPGPLLAAVVREIVALGLSELLDALAAISKPASKEIKRALHLRKAAGAEAPVLHESREAVFRPPQPAADEPNAWVTTPDPFGHRVAWFGRGEPGRGLHVFQVAFSDMLGVLEVAEAQLPRKAWRELGDRLGAAGPVMAIEVERVYARWMVHLATEKNLSLGMPLPDGSQRILAALGPAPETPPLSPGRALVPADAGLAAALTLDLAATLFTEQPLASWIPDEDALRALALKLDEVQHSPLVLDESQKLSLREKAVLEAAEKYWTVERRNAWAGRLYDVALALSRAGRTQSGERAAAVAAQLEGSEPAGLIEYCRLLFARAFRDLPGAPPGQPAGPHPAQPGGRILVP